MSYGIPMLLGRLKVRVIILNIPNWYYLLQWEKKFLELGSGGSRNGELCKGDQRSLGSLIKCGLAEPRRGSNPEHNRTLTFLVGI